MYKSVAAGIQTPDLPLARPTLNFTLKNLVFEQNHMKVTCFGIKNDTQGKGFEVILPKSNVVKIDPVQTLYDYIERTREHRDQDGHVLISLRSPYNAFDSSTVSRILDPRGGYCFGMAIYQRVIGEIFSSLCIDIQSAICTLLMCCW